MTLRARLTAAFLAVVLGPVLLGAIFVGVAVAAVSDQLPPSASTPAPQNVHAALAVTCQRLRLAAETRHSSPPTATSPTPPQRAVTPGPRPRGAR